MAATAARERRVPDEAERAAVELALKLAEKIVGAAIEAEPEAVLGVVAGALRRATVRDHLVLEVNPADFQLVHDRPTSWRRGSAACAGWTSSPSGASSRGGCVVRTEEGEIDARIEEQLERAGEVVGRPAGRVPRRWLTPRSSAPLGGAAAPPTSTALAAASPT